MDDSGESPHESTIRVKLGERATETVSMGRHATYREIFTQLAGIDNVFTKLTWKSNKGEERIDDKDYDSPIMQAHAKEGFLLFDVLRKNDKRLNPNKLFLCPLCNGKCVDTQIKAHLVRCQEYKTSLIREYAKISGPYVTHKRKRVDNDPVNKE